MNRGISALLGVAMSLASAAIVLAQSSNSPDADAAAGCAACGGCGLFFVLLVVGGLVLNVALLVWVARDAKNRGMDSAVLWVILVLCTGLLGLLVYIFSRPQGGLIKCAQCHNKRLQASATCPHCGNA